MPYNKDGYTTEEVIVLLAALTGLLTWIYLAFNFGYWLYLTYL